MATIRDLAVRSLTFRKEDVGEQIHDRFRNHPDLLLVAVVDGDNRPVGLVERHSFFLKMASHYGRALYTKRPVALIMDSDPLIVDADGDISAFTASSLSDRPSDLLRGFIVVEGGRYLGVGTALGLLRATSTEARRGAVAMRRLAERLRQAKVAAERDKLFIDTVVENIPTMLFVKSTADERFVLVNRAAEETLGYSRADMIGRSAAEVFPAEEAALIAAQDREAVSSGQVQTIGEERVRRSDGAERRFSTRKLAIADETGQPRWILAVSEDITERKAAQAQIEHMAHYDALTGLANRVQFHRQLDEALDAARGRGEGAAVFCIDLDHFKAVNDTLGHAAGDALLAQAAARLRDCVRADDAVARLGGDEFAIVQTGPSSAEQAQRLAARVVAAVSQPYEVAGQQMVVGASVGLAVFPQDGTGGAELLKKADMALYKAKSGGRGAYAVFSAEMDAALQARRALEVDLRGALHNGELMLHYQPLLDLGSGRLTGCEALLRWDHPTRGLVPPGAFIGLAEEIGLIRPIGEWVLRAACQEAASWPGEATLAVNVSPVQFRDRDLVRTVASALASSGLAPSRLELEITESLLLQDDEANLRILHQLRQLGCRVALDDFGTGYSALSYLRRFPFTKIKIDRSFVKDLPDNAESMAIVRAVVGLAASLGMTTTAEGVETEVQLAQVRALGCTQAQGYLIGRPTPTPATTTRRWLALQEEPLRATG